MSSAADRKVEAKIEVFKSISCLIKDLIILGMATVEEYVERRYGISAEAMSSASEDQSSSRVVN